MEILDPLAAPPPPPAASGPPFEVLPGVFADPALGVRWTDPAPRPPAASKADAPAPLKANGGLAPYVPSASAPWDRARALHLLRRTGYGARPAAVDAVLALGPDAAVQALVDGAASIGALAPPAWHDDAPPAPPPNNAPQAEQDEYRRVLQVYLDANTQWIYEMEWRTITEGLGGTEADALAGAARAFHERLTVGWHDHFVASVEAYTLAGWLSRYWRTLQRHALGDFRAFVAEIGTSPAMLVYLNGIQNRVGAPNENYARELMELFTMGAEANGQPNYTQQDVAQAARCLTGYTVDVYGTLEAVFVPAWHDNGIKTVLGRTGNWGHDDLVQILFDERANEIATFVARKLYRDVVYDTPNETVVAQLAGVLLANDFALAPAVAALLKSAHFFDGDSIGARIKSPLEHVLGVHAESGTGAIPALQDTIRAITFVTDQRLFYPPNVAGWPGHRDWLTSSTLPTRWLYTNAILSGIEAVPEALRGVALALPSPYVARDLAVDFATLWLGTAVDPADTPAVDRLIGVLLGDIPEYEWDPTAPGAGTRLMGLALHLAVQPEYQLA
ncbi:DUF1800 domain-containing protein [Rubrivirga sp. IMCC45206]|uniref:DUF1800 domain-containing protein n=1 Tax=Rubrivirga sp. IMCC45206 TaxID=3391614 RepID=UPI0039901D99